MPGDRAFKSPTLIWSWKAAFGGCVLLGALCACGAGSEADAPPGGQPSAGGDANNSVDRNGSGEPLVSKIMPLGDSITESRPGLPSYRYFLWHLALDKQYRIDFVGSRRGVGGAPPLHTDFDLDHEGHADWRADQILERIEEWATEAKPDVVLLHLGHNDLCEGQSAASTVQDIAGIIDALRRVNPRIAILLAQVIATDYCPIPAFNARLPALAADKATAESPIVLVDQYTGFDPATMTVDGLHPNATGESRMAERWFDKLAHLLDRLSAR